MSNLSAEQLAFAKTMTPRQWGTLRSLAICPFYLSASERGDPEIYALIQVKLASCRSPAAGITALFSWSATDAGKDAVRMKDSGNL